MWILGSYIHETHYYGDDVDRHWILYNGEFDHDHYDAVLVNGDTVGQYTGIRDIDGRRVFEGDIIRFCGGYAEGKWVGTIEYDDRNALFLVKGFMPCRRCSLDTGEYRKGLSSIDKDTIEIIGNRWDNIDILEDPYK